MTFQELQKVTEITLNTTLSRDENYSLFVELLSNSIDYYNWVDFILKSRYQNIALRALCSAETDHTVIPLKRNLRTSGSF
jgi:hypothetical protein